MRNYKLYLKDILESIERIGKSLKNVTKEVFEKDVDIQDAVLRRLEIISEAASNIPHEIKAKYVNIEWKKIIGFRIVVAHTYFNVDMDIVWDIIENELPKLKKEISEILEKEKR